jgi:Na+-driven multidrug efflux pump
MQVPGWTESRLLVNLAIPTILALMGSVIPSAMTASYIGRQLGPIYLDGFTLASLTGNLLTLSLLTGLFSASETLSPQAFGAGNYKEVGLLAIRGFVGSFFLMIPINIVLIPYMQDILVWAGQDEVTSGLAARWYRIYVYSIPFHALYDVTWTFLSSQEVMTPLLVVVVGTCGVILPTALTILVKCMGFLGSAVALVVYQASQAGLLILYLVYYQPHHPLTWPGLHLWREALAFQPIMNYMRLGVGGMLANSVCVYVHEYAGPLSLSFIHISLSLLSLSLSLSLLSLSLSQGVVVLGSAISLCGNIGCSPAQCSRDSDASLDCLFHDSPWNWHCTFHSTGCHIATKRETGPATSPRMHPSQHSAIYHHGHSHVYGPQFHFSTIHDGTKRS